MADRRHFLRSTLSAVGASAPFVRRGRKAPIVEAHSTIFYAHPNAEQMMVRFVVTDADAPAGRMRLFAPGRRLLGTAGVIGSGGRLYGELWVRVGREIRVQSELELPGRSTPIRTQHTITPKRRWNLHWLTVVNPEELSERLAGLSPAERGIQLAVIRSTQVGGNPYPLRTSPAELLDNVPFLRSATGALDLELEFGVPSSRVAVATADALRLDSAPIALNGAGVYYAILVDDTSGAQFGVLQSRDGSRIVSVSPVPGGDPRALGFASSRDVMANRIEEWLTTSPTLLSPMYRPNTALVVSSTVDEDRAAMALAVQEWNTRFAYPRIVIGEESAFFGMVEREVGVQMGVPDISFPGASGAPDRAAVEEATQQRQSDLTRRVDEMLEPVNQMMGAVLPGVAGFASGFAAQYPGTIVFNPSPISRTDVVRMPDGSERLVTDVPPMGYVYIPSVDAGTPAPYFNPGDTAVSGARLSVRVSPQTGGIVSAFDRIQGREWTRRGGELNGLPGASMQRARRVRIPGIGSRLIVSRSTRWGEVETTITVYEEQTWIDIENRHSTSPDRPITFDLAVVSPTVSWETPAGWEERGAPTDSLVHLRWLQLKGEDGWRVFFRGLDAPYVRLVTSAPEPPAGSLEQPTEPATDATIESYVSGGVSRYRLDFGGTYTSPDEAWFFGWGAEPFVSAETARGGTILPSYGRLLRISVGALALGLKRADDGDGAILYLQDIAGVSRDVGVQPDVLAFSAARVVDLVERNVGERLSVDENGTNVPIRAFGVAAVRLSGLALSGG